MTVLKEWLQDLKTKTDRPETVNSWLSGGDWRKLEEFRFKITEIHAIPNQQKTNKNTK